jgi:adenylate kinase
MIFVAGTSSSGKTYMLSRLAELRPDVVVVSGSRTLAEIGQPTTLLSREQAYDNQWALLNELRARELLGRPGAILDGHATIETTEGLIAIPDEWFDAIHFDGVIHVTADPALIAKRRASCGRPCTAAEAASLQERERRELVRQANRLGMPYLEISSSDAEAAGSFLGAALSNPAEGRDSR